MKKTALSMAAALFALGLAAQTAQPYEFKEFKNLPATPVKSQDQTGTCWAFSSASFLESEAIRLKKGEHNLSEMFVVRHIYRQKCDNYVRRQGRAQFGEGGLAHDLLNAVKAFGIVTEASYPGRKDPKKPYNHSQLEKNLKKKCDELVQQGQKGELAENWLSEIDRMLDEEFGPVPSKFTVDGLVFTPLTYRDFLGLKPDDYVTITSFAHHPFWEKFVLEIPDNWANGQFYNLPLSDLMRCANYSIQQGYTLEWDADVSNEGFSAKNGLAIVPATAWKDKDAAAQSNTFKYWEPQQTVTQESRQKLFDRQITMDDHLMHVTGILDETHTGVYYVVKNSWGEISDRKGYVYCSEAYVRQNTISFTVHKDALPVDIRRRLGLEAGDVTIEKAKPATTGSGKLQPSKRPRLEKPAEPIQKPSGN
jgi:bleomycin hydrolase